jgi:hypothetical protein
MAFQGGGTETLQEADKTMRPRGRAFHLRGPVGAGMAGKGARVVRVTGPVVLDLGHGVRIRVVPEARGATAAAARGRPPSPATQTLVDAMRRDRAAGRARTRAEYLAILARGGHKGSPQSASLIVLREAKRLFGRPLGRRGRRAGSRAPGGGRKPSPATRLLRERLAKDKAAGSLHDAAHYARWLADKSRQGLKRVRPVVYRELRALT